MNDLSNFNLRELIERETGERFNSQGYIKCPFHSEKTPSLTVKYNASLCKDTFKCFGCEVYGDAIDFISKLKNFTYVEAKKYLGMPVNKSFGETLEDRIRKYAQWEISKFRKNNELVDVFTFVDENNEPKYFKVKFKLLDGSKQISYYHFEKDKIVNTRGVEELPYNLFNLINGVRSNKAIIVVEGEKDANTVNSILGQEYVATSIKGCKDLEVILKENYKPKIIIIGDTGRAGEKYKKQVYESFKDYAYDIRIVNLPGIKALGDNKDVTDWINIGHNKRDLLNAIKRSLNLKSKQDLQQDFNGIYKTVFKQKLDELLEFKKYITDFNVLEATRIKFVEEDEEGIRLKLQSINGEIIERVGDVTVFDDIRSFKNFLSTLELSFKGNIEDLTELKGWINRYFALDIEHVYEGMSFIEKDEEIYFVMEEGAIGKEGIDKSIKSIKSFKSMLEIPEITKEEFKLVRKYLFKFLPLEKSISIIGTLINDLAAYQNQAIKGNMHHLLIAGESGSGKSTILRNVIAPILNYDGNEIKSIGLITPFAFIRDLSEGNYPSLYDEFKPSSLDKYKVAKISEILRNLYDRSAVSRADKLYRTKRFDIRRPLILVGEEGYPNQEKALIERSCILYLSKKERNEESSEAVNWIMKNEHLLNKLGRSLINVITNLSVKEYKNITEKVALELTELNGRPLNTAINICAGIEILNILGSKLRVERVGSYASYVVENLKNEVLENGKDVRSTVEQMLYLYNDMIETGRALGCESVVINRYSGLYIKTTEMIDQIQEHVARFNSDINPLKLRDFKKQASKSGYLIASSDKVIKVNGKAVKFDTYDAALIRELGLTAILSEEF